MAANAITSVLAARLLGPEGIGAFAVGLAFYGVLMLVAAVGLGVGTSWQVGGGSWSPRSALSSTRVAAILIGSGAAVIGAATFSLTRGSIFEGVPTLGVLAVLAAVPLALVWSHAQNVAVAAQHYDLGLRIPAVQSGGYVLFVAALGATAGVEGALVALLLSNVVAAGLASAWARAAFGGHDPLRVDWSRVRVAMAFGVPVWAGQVLAVVVQRADVFVLSAAHGRDEVGHYAVAVAVTTPLWLLPTGLGAVLLPHLARPYRDRAGR